MVRRLKIPLVALMLAVFTASFGASLYAESEKSAEQTVVKASSENLDLSVEDYLKKYPEGKTVLKNPYDPADKKLVAEGREVYMSYSCNGCHGGTGGGGMCPPLTNDIWVYGNDDDTLFRLISHGTKKLGRARKRTERVKGPMPPFGELLETADQLWKIITFVRWAKIQRDKQN